jgi:hypothetical protein
MAVCYGVLIFSLYGALGSSDYKLSNGRLTNELERIWKESEIASLTYKLGKCLEEKEKYYEVSELVNAVRRQRLETGNFRIRVHNVAALSFSISSRSYDH